VEARGGIGGAAPGVALAGAAVLQAAPVKAPNLLLISLADPVQRLRYPSSQSASS
jgi:hypothetical protein